MDIHGKSVDMDMDVDGKFHIQGKPGSFCHEYQLLYSSNKLCNTAEIDGANQ